MTSPVTFLDEEYQSLDNEEAYLKGIMMGIREVETELREEEKEVFLLEKIIRKLKELVVHFQNNVFPKLAIYIAQLHSSQNRQYDTKLDEYILNFAELEYYLGTLSIVIQQIGEFFKRKTEKQLEEDKFYSRLRKEHDEANELVSNTRTLLFGTTSTHNIYKLDYRYLSHGENKTSFINRHFQEMRKSFMQKYQMR